MPKSNAMKPIDDQLPSLIPGSASQAPASGVHSSDPVRTEENQPPTRDLSAEDLDLIEKEWVIKAKQVVEDTQGDPYLQTRELNKIKADYLKKRYNRTIKPNE